MELHISKIVTEDQNRESIKPRSLTFEELGEFLFDILGINPEDCLAVNFNTGRYDQREIKFKPGINTSSYLRLDPVSFKDHSIKVTRQSQNITRVTFKNVPLNVPDEEILNLCRCYGRLVDKTVNYKALDIKKMSNLTGGTCFATTLLLPRYTLLTSKQHTNIS